MTGSATERMPAIAHIGYHRTGTNFLQDEVFPLLDRHLYLPERSGWYFFDDPKGFDEAAARAHYRAEQRNNPAGLPLLVTHERLTGTEEADDLDAARKLHRLNPRMRIVVVLRAQPDMFRSLYHLHVKRGGADRYPAFVERLVAGGRCDYHRMVTHLTGLFGAPNVLVLLYEDLARAPDRFLNRLCDFLAAPLPNPLPGRSVNARESDSSLRVKRFLNSRRDSSGALGKLGLALAHKADRLTARLGGAALTPINTEAQQPVIAARHAEGNRRLADLLGRDLAELGYPR